MFLKMKSRVLRMLVCAAAGALCLYSGAACAATLYNIKPTGSPTCWRARSGLTLRAITWWLPCGARSASCWSCALPFLSDGAEGRGLDFSAVVAYYDLMRGWELWGFGRAGMQGIERGRHTTAGGNAREKRITKMDVSRLWRCRQSEDGDARSVRTGIFAGCMESRTTRAAMK